MICTDYSYLVQEICFAEVMCPITLRSVLPNHDPQWLRDCMRRGRRSPRSLCCGTDKSETDSMMPIMNGCIEWYFQVFRQIVRQIVLRRMVEPFLPGRPLETNSNGHRNQPRRTCCRVERIARGSLWRKCQVLLE